MKKLEYINLTTQTTTMLDNDERKQIAMLSTNPLHSFFHTIDLLIKKGDIVNGRDFIINNPTTVTLRNRQDCACEVSLQPTGMNLLHLNMDMLYNQYHFSINRNEALSRTSLMAYLESFYAYIGRSKQTSFRWIEIKSTHPSIKINSNMSSSSVVLNYDILKDLLGINFN